MAPAELSTALVRAARILAKTGLVDAFGHVSARLDDARFLITPPKPLGHLHLGEPLVEVSLSNTDLPREAPGETWIHWAIYRARPDVNAICRAQPRTAMGMHAAGSRLQPLSGHAAFLGEVRTFEAAFLVRSRELAERVAASLGQQHVIVLKGNGAVAVGATLEDAVSRMWVLERLAQMQWIALAAPRLGKLNVLTPEEVEAWRLHEKELLRRIWLYLSSSENAEPEDRKEG